MVGLSGFSLNAQLARRAGRTRICATQPYRFIIHRRRRWKIRDRLSEGEIAQIVQEFKAGTPKHVLAERAQQRSVAEQAREVVDVEVAQIRRDDIAPMLLNNGREAPVDFGERLVPGGGAPRLPSRIIGFRSQSGSVCNSLKLYALRQR